MGDGDAARRRRGSAVSSQLQHEPADDTDETETISSGEVARLDRDDIKLQQGNQLSDTWNYPVQSGSLAASTPTHRRPRPGVEVVHSLDELAEISSIAAVVTLQRWWRRHNARGQRVTQLQRLCRKHVLQLIRRRRALHARSKLHAIVLQIIFLGIFTYSTLHGYDHDRLYRFTRAVTSQYLETPFITSASGASKIFTDIASAEELFEWLKGPFVTITYTEGSSTTSMNNRVIGGIRVGQLRVQAFNCSSRVTPFFSWMQDSNEDEEFFCYGSTDGEFSLNTESTDPIQVSNADTYVFEGLNGTDTDTERSAFFSEMSVASAQYSVPPPAYSVVLPRSNKIQAFSIFEALESNGYIDEKTRVVMLDLSMYNAMLRHVAVLRFTVEFPASGGAVTSLSEGVAPLTSSFLLDVDHWVTSAIHITVILFYAYFFLDEVLAIARSHSRQWQYQSVWQRSNLGKTHVKSKMRPSPLHRRHGAGVRLVGIFCYIAVWMLRLVALVKRPSELPLDSDEFVPLRPYVETFRAAQLALSACVCLAWLELLLKLRVSLHVDLLVRAVVCATPQLFALIIMVSLVVMGYASACLIVFGAQSSLFQSLPEALRSLLAVLLQTGTGAGATGSSALLGFSSHSYGEVGHDAAGTSTLRTLLLACFLLFNVFVAANLFLVVVYEGYLKARREIDIDRQQSRQHRGRLLDENDDRIDAAPMHLDLRNEAKVYFHAVINKFISFAPRRLRVIAKRSRAAEMQSSVLPADVDQTLTSEYDGGDDNYREDSSSSPKQQRVNSKYARGPSHSSPNRGRNRSHIRGGAQDPPSDNTRLLEGMVLQLALQNEALLRAVNELKQDVQALQRNGDMGLSDRDILRRGSLIPMPARAQRQRKPSIASSGKPLVTIPDSQNNLTL